MKFQSLFSKIFWFSILKTLVKLEISFAVGLIPEIAVQSFTQTPDPTTKEPSLTVVGMSSIPIWLEISSNCSGKISADIAPLLLDNALEC